MFSHYGVRSPPDTISVLVVLIVVKIQTLAQSIETMKLMKNLHLCHEATPVRSALFDHARRESDTLCVFLRNDVVS
jgi:hypothetical protein